MARPGKRLFITAVLFTAATAVSLRGQSPQGAPPAPEPQATFRSSVEAVQLSVIVTDEDGRPVAGLTEADFEILENGVARPVTTFSAVDIPILSIKVRCVSSRS